MRPRQGCLFASLVTVLATARPARAQDVWMVPRTPIVRTVDEARDVPVSVYAGDSLIADAEKPFARADTRRFLVTHGTESRDLLATGVEHSLPFARVSFDSPGGHLLVVDRVAEHFSIKPAAFDAYLHRRGFVDVIAERERRGESTATARERATSSLKALVQVGPTRDGTFANEVGGALEILPRIDPSRVSPGTPLPVLVKWRGLPLAGAKLGVFGIVRGSFSSGSVESPFWTDAEGIASIPIDARGFWMLQAARMVRCEACPDAEWESFWATYVFANGDPGSETVVAPPMSGAPSRETPPPSRGASDFVLAMGLVGVVCALSAVAHRVWKKPTGRAG